jgi:hypothetical protein
VWLRDETCVTVGEAAAGKSVPVRCAGRPAPQQHNNSSSSNGDRTGWTYVEGTWPPPEARPSAGFS